MSEDKTDEAPNEQTQEPPRVRHWPSAASVIHLMSRCAPTTREIHLESGHATMEETQEMLTALANEALVRIRDPLPGERPSTPPTWELTPAGTAWLGLTAHLAGGERHRRIVHLANLGTGGSWCQDAASATTPPTSLVSESNCERCLIAVIQISESARSAAEAQLSTLRPRSEGKHALAKSGVREVTVLRPDGVPLVTITAQSDLGAELRPIADALVSALDAGRVHLTPRPSPPTQGAWIPEQEFQVGDVVTWTADPGQGPLYRLITAVRVGPPEVKIDEGESRGAAVVADDMARPSDASMFDPEGKDVPEREDRDARLVRTYTWEYLDRGIRHGYQRRDDDDYPSEWSSDPQMRCWRRVLRGARREDPTRTTEVDVFAAVGVDGARPVVWGLGETPDAAIADADAQGCDDWRSGGFDTCRVSAAVATRVRAGCVDCDSLGIAVVTRDGEIAGVESGWPARFDRALCDRLIAESDEGDAPELVEQLSAALAEIDRMSEAAMSRPGTRRGEP